MHGARNMKYSSTQATGKLREIRDEPIPAKKMVGQTVAYSSRASSVPTLLLVAKEMIEMT